MTSRTEQPREPDLISTEGGVGESRRVIKGIKDPLNDIVGTPNQVIVTVSGTQIILSTPQDIDTDADVIFDTLAIDLISFNLTPGLSPGEGELVWNEDDGTLDLGLPGGNVTLQLGQEVHTPRSKAIGSDIDNGELVYVSGATGVIPEMSLAKADASSTASGTIAMATEDITQNQAGFYTAFGLVRDVNTDPVTYTEGDQLYLSPTIAGGFTNVKPVQPYFIVKIGIVIRAHATEGVIFVTITQRTNNFEHIRGMTANSIPYANSDGFLDETNPGLTFDGTHFYIGADNAKAYLGAGNDFSIFYDAVDAWIKTNEVAASDLLIECGTQKTIELQTVVWDDLRVAVSSVSRLGFTDPDWVKILDDGAGSVGVYGLGFSDTLTEEVFFTVQIPHVYKEGTNIIPHIHWLPLGTDTGVVEWSLEYTFANVNGTFGTTTTIAATDAGDGTAYKQQIAQFGSISGAGATISSMLLCRLYRDGGGGSDTYTGDAVLLELDFHHEINTMGSRQEFIK